MSLKPGKPRMRDRFLNIFRSRSPSSHLAPSHAPSDHDSLSAVSQSPAQLNQPNKDPADFGSRSSPDRPPAPINVPVNHQNTGNMGETAIEVVKESLKLVARISDAFPPLKTAAAGLVEIFDRIDAVKGVQVESKQLHEQVEKLGRILEAYQGELPASANLKDRLDGLHRALEEKRVALEEKLNPSRSIAMRIIFSTEDGQFLAQVLREITFSIEVTTFDITLKSNLEITKMSDNLSRISDNAVLDKLGQVVGAEFNREGRPNCTVGTRVSLLSTLLEWATAGESPYILWLNGMAGTGKTTVMETFCSILNKKGLLGASFFSSIKSKTPRRDIGAIFPSIAQTLARNHPRFREILVGVLATFSDPLGMNLKDQYHTLILDPAEEAFRKDEIIVICIDALDECEDQEGTEKLLNTILDRKPNIPLRFFVTSRPEWHIREAFKQKDHLPLRLHDIEDLVVKADISIYLNDRLGGVQRLRQHYGSSWPPPEIGVIVERAGKLFIYASTILKYITNYRGDPFDRLQKMASLQSPVAVAVEHIEKLYSFILSEAFREIDDKESLRIWSCLSILISTRRPLSVSTYAKLSGANADLIRTALESLHSVIIVPEGDDQQISIYHASFLDYLATRADDMRPAHHENATRCFRFMNSELCLGISGATTSHKSNDDQPQALLVPAHLKYTCTAWGYLVLQLIGRDNLIVEDIRITVEAFLRTKFLYWLEVLSAMGNVSHASRLLYRLSQKVPESQPLKLILMDFVKFTNTFLLPIQLSAPHIYISALPLSAPSSMVSKLFLPKFPSLPLVHWSSENKHDQDLILQFEGHTNLVTCVLFSPDGKYIASASCDHTIRLWDVETGEAARKPFEGHKDEVRSLAFSPNGEHIASGSKDHTIRLWNIETGKMTWKPFEGDIVECATSVLFSSDGKYIIFASKNYTIQLWNIETGEMVSKPLAGHDEDDQVSCSAISPDGKHIACASGKGGIQLWNIENGKETFKLKPLEGFTWVSSVSFSLDGKHLVGSGRCTIHLWNVETGEAGLNLPFDVRQEFVYSVMFSPDGKYIVSGSIDSTVRVWNAETGEAASRPFIGHRFGAVSTSFSPDGKYVVSGSWDMTIRLWKFEADKVALRPFEGHTDTITSVSFSPDGKHLVSGSLDCTLRLWNVETGELVMKPFGGHPSNSVSFSPDGEYIASGSWDSTTQLWNAKNGELEAEFTPFERHHELEVEFTPFERRREPAGSVASVSFSPDGKHIASGSSDYTAVHLWNIKTGKTTLRPFGKYTSSDCISFSLDGKYIAAGSSDGTIQVWNIKTGEVAFKSFETYEDGVECIAFSADEKHIVACSSNGKIRLWNVKTGEFQEHRMSPNSIMSVAISPDGKYITFGSYGTIQLWTIGTDGPESKDLGGHLSFVGSVSFSSNGKYVASASDDCTIRIYNNNFAEQIHYDLRAAQATFLHQYPTGSFVTMTSLEGWLQYPSGELLLWVPPELHLGLYFPGVVHVIGADSIKIEISKFVHGNEWLRCQEERCEPAIDTLI